MSSGLADALRERILSGAVPPHMPVRQDALAAELGVSKIPLREATTTADTSVTTPPAATDMPVPNSLAIAPESRSGPSNQVRIS